MQTKLKKGLALLLSVVMVMTLTCGAWAAVEDTFRLKNDLTADATPDWDKAATWQDGTTSYPGSSATLNAKAVLDGEVVKVIFKTPLLKDLAELNVAPTFSGKALELKAALKTDTLTIEDGDGPYSIVLYNDGNGSLTLNKAGIIIEAKADNTENITITGRGAAPANTDPLLTIGIGRTGTAGSTDGKGKITLTKSFGVDGDGLWNAVIPEGEEAPLARLSEGALEATGLTIALSKDIALYAGEAGKKNVTTLTAYDGELTVKPTDKGDFIGNAGNFIVGTTDSVTLSGKAKLSGDIVGGNAAAALETYGEDDDTFTLADAAGKNAIIMTAADSTSSSLALGAAAKLIGDKEGLTLNGGILTFAGEAEIQGTLTLDNTSKAAKLAGAVATATLTGDAIAVKKGGKLTIGTDGSLELGTGDAIEVESSSLTKNDILKLNATNITVSEPEMVEGKVVIENLTTDGKQLELGNAFLISKDATLTLTGEGGSVVTVGSKSTITNNGTLAFESKNAILGQDVYLVNNNVLAIQDIKNIATLWKATPSRLTFASGYTLKFNDDITPGTDYVFDMKGGASFDIAAGHTLTLDDSKGPNITNGVLQLHKTDTAAAVTTVKGAMYLKKDAGLVIDNEGGKLTLNELTISADAGAKFVIKKDVWDVNSVTVKAISAKGAVLDTTALAEKLSDDKKAPADVVAYLILNTVEDTSADKWPTVTGKYVYVSGDNKKYDIPFVAVSGDKKFSVGVDVTKTIQHKDYSLATTVSPAPTATVAVDSLPITWAVSKVDLKEDGTTVQTIPLTSVDVTWTLSSGDQTIVTSTDKSFVLEADKVVAGNTYTLALAVKYTPEDGGATVNGSDSHSFTVSKSSSGGGEEAPAPAQSTVEEPTGATNYDKQITVGSKKAYTFNTGATAVALKLGAWKDENGTAMSSTDVNARYDKLVVRVKRPGKSAVDSPNIKSQLLDNDSVAINSTLVPGFSVAADGDQFTVQVIGTTASTGTASIAAESKVTGEATYIVKPGILIPTAKNTTQTKTLTGAGTINLADYESNISWENMLKAIDSKDVAVTWTLVSGDGASISGKTLSVTKTVQVVANATGKMDSVKASEAVPFTLNVTVNGGPSDSGGGCAAGFAGLALLVVAPMFLKKK